MSSSSVVDDYDYNCDDCDDRVECIVCGTDDAHESMDSLCADCYWYKDSQRKKACRADPVWRFDRIVSFAITCMNMDNDSAIAFALKTMKEKPSHPVKTD